MEKIREYKLNCSDYVLHENEIPIGPLLPEVALAFSFEAEDKLWMVYKHGSPQSVHAWVKKQKNMQVGSGGLADGLHVLEGKLPVHDLNRVLKNDQTLGILMKNLVAVGDSTNSDMHVIRIDGRSISKNGSGAFPLLKTLLAGSAPSGVSAARDEVTDVVVKQRRMQP